MSPPEMFTSATHLTAASMLFSPAAAGNAGCSSRPSAPCRSRPRRRRAYRRGACRPDVQRGGRVDAVAEAETVVTSPLLTVMKPLPSLSVVVDLIPLVPGGDNERPAPI